MLVLLSSFNFFAQKTNSDSISLNNFILHKVNTLNKTKIEKFIDLKKDSIFYINIGLCESIFLHDYFLNDNKLKSNNYYYINQPAHRELEKPNLVFYEKINKMRKQNKHIILKPLYKLEPFEKYIDLVQYLINTKDTIPVNIKKTLNEVKETIFETYSDQELKPIADGFVKSFKTHNDLYKLYFKGNYFLLELIMKELELKLNGSENEIKLYRKTQIAKNFTGSKSVLIMLNKEEDEVLELFK